MYCFLFFLYAAELLRDLERVLLRVLLRDFDFDFDFDAGVWLGLREDLRAGEMLLLLLSAGDFAAGDLDLLREREDGFFSSSSRRGLTEPEREALRVGEREEEALRGEREREAALREDRERSRSRALSRPRPPRPRLLERVRDL